MPKVSVITSSIGRPELSKCIQSVRSQTMEAKHYVFVNGERWHPRAKDVFIEYPGVHAFYLPEETGDYGAGHSMADVFAAAPFLTRADWILFLDDDNWFERDHVESMVTFAEKNSLDWAFSLRKIVSQSGIFICDDDWVSTGPWNLDASLPPLVDNSCYLVSRKLATRYGLAWTAAPVIADRAFFMALQESGAPYGCTGLSTVNYRTGTGTAQDVPAEYLRSAAEARAAFPEGFPWRTPTVFRDGKTIPI